VLKKRKDAGLNQVSWWGNRGVQIEIKTSMSSKSGARLASIGWGRNQPSEA